MIVVDTGGMIALLDADDKHHAAVLEVFETCGDEWVLPWAILAEVDYLASTRLGERVARGWGREAVAGWAWLAIATRPRARVQGERRADEGAVRPTFSRAPTLRHRR